MSTRSAFQDFVRRDAPLREASVARFMSVACGCSALAALALLPIIGAPLSLALTALLGLLFAYYLAQLRFARRGVFHEVTPWLNMFIEVSAPAGIFIVDHVLKGPLYALTAPPFTIWGTLVALSGLRGDRRLALAAGAIAATEYALLYFGLARHSLPADIVVTLQSPMIAIRVGLLFLSGLLTTIIVSHLNRRAEAALSAIRQRDLFGKYLLGERIGAGGMAEVYRATYAPEGGFEKIVALKRMLPSVASDPRFVEMFRAEASLGSRLNHPNVVQVLDFGRFNDTYFLAMEYVPGVPLSKCIDLRLGSGLPVAAVVHIATMLCESLDYIHRRRGTDGEPLNLIHRDLNPPNVLISQTGEVKLTDFGIARASELSRVNLTTAGMVKGKTPYMAPEQALGLSIDGRVDLFALGVTLWEALVGQRLFTGPTEVEILEAALNAPIPAPITLRPETPTLLNALVMGLLQRDLRARIDSAARALPMCRELVHATGDGATALGALVREAEAANAARESQFVATLVVNPPEERQ